MITCENLPLIAKIERVLATAERLYRERRTVHFAERWTKLEHAAFGMLRGVVTTWR